MTKIIALFAALALPIALIGGCGSPSAVEDSRAAKTDQPFIFESHEYCIIGSKETRDGKSSCTNCKSQLGGDLGKADCLLRKGGDHVNDGVCTADGCYEVR